MFRHCLNSLNSKNLNNIIKNCSTASTTLNQKWDLLTAVCIERKPIITPPLNEIETEYQKYVSQVEHERSHKSNFELKHQNDLEHLKVLKEGGTTDQEIVVTQTAQDFYDASTEELKKFKLSERETSADKEKNQKSLKRKLDKHLVLVTKQKLGDNSYYILPQTNRNEGETLRQTANRLLKESFGDELNALIYGNAPAGFYKYKYPHNMQNESGSVGAKVFIYFARYKTGEVGKKGFEYKWLDRGELEKELLPNYHHSVAQFLVDED